MRSSLSHLPWVILHCLVLITPTGSVRIDWLPSRILPRFLTSRAESGLPPRPNDKGICFQYAVNEMDTCHSIAEAHQITPAEIETYNAAVWRWTGCANINQGDFLCLSPGEPVMPVALPQATCGPQVPGTARSDNYALLSTLNPCPASHCCTVEGSCVLADNCPADDCISNCGIPAKSEPHETINAETEAPPEPTTRVAPPKSTTEPETPAENNPPAKTTVAESPAWTLSAYTWLHCDGNYLVFVGHKEDSGKCIDIHGGYSSELSRTGVSCRYYWDGGANSSDCDSSPSLGIHSWSLTGGSCTAYHKQCDNSGRERVKISPQAGCQANLQRRPHYYMHWGSVQCEVT